ncbi:MAG: TIGR03905 family TSCPD domain-containing protein [Clostridia bacterium]|nr:TIGR03905 family TSCPD domain-containing protein [Clostridia bacterium]
MTHKYTTRGVCSRSVTFDLSDGIVHNVRFEGGCAGNTQGVAALIEGMAADEAIRRLQGIRCGFKSTSCPDQLATALQKALEA